MEAETLRIAFHVEGEILVDYFHVRFLMVGSYPSSDMTTVSLFLRAEGRRGDRPARLCRIYLIFVCSAIHVHVEI